MGTPPDRMPYRTRRAERRRLLDEQREILRASEATGRDLTPKEQVALDASTQALNALVETPVNITCKADLVDLLRDSGLPRAAAERVAAGGYDALAQDAAIFNLGAQIEALTKSLKEKP